MNQENRNILFNANALIDFQKTDFSVLGEVRQHLGNLYLLKEIRDEVQGLTQKDCRSVDLKVISSKDHIKNIANQPYGSLSRPDRLNLYTSIDSGFSLVTNDLNLRKACEERQVKIIWGLQLLLILIEKSDYSINDAIKIGKMIGNKNRYISEEIVNDFVARAEIIRNNRTL